MTTDTNTRTPYTPTTAHNTMPALPSQQTLNEKKSVAASGGSANVRLAAQRLTRSRALLQTALEPHSIASKSPTASVNNRTVGAQAPAPSAGLSAIPGFDLGVEAVKFWWSRHPLRLAVALLANTADAAIKPAAQRNPVALISGAFLIGGLLAWARPWRLVVKPILFAGVMPQITSALLSHFSAGVKKNSNSTKH